MKYEEYMMESVCSALDELVSGGGTLTEAQADEVFDLACEKYISEARRLDKEIIKKADKLLKTQDEIKNSNLSDDDKNELLGRLVPKANKITVDHTFSDGSKTHYDTADIKMHNGILTKQIRNYGGAKNYINKNMRERRFLDGDLKPNKAGKSEITHNKKRYDMTPAEEKKPGKYLDMYNNKKEKNKFSKMIDEI